MLASGCGVIVCFYSLFACAVHVASQLVDEGDEVRCRASLDIEVNTAD